MLPNHSPLLIAEQFGTLASLHPGRIDLGLGRAPGSDQATMRALRRDPMTAEHFPQDVARAAAACSAITARSRVFTPFPARARNVPLYILGLVAVRRPARGSRSVCRTRSRRTSRRARCTTRSAIYRERFAPSEQLDRPYVIAGVNVIAADTEAAALAQLERARRARVRGFFGRGDRRLTDDEVEAILRSPQGAAVEAMLTYTGTGTPGTVMAYLDEFQRHTGADELVVVHHASTVEQRLHSVELLANS